MNCYISTVNITHKKDGLLISESLTFLIMGTGGIEIGGSLCPASNLRIGVVYRWSVSFGQL